MFTNPSNGKQVSSEEDEKAGSTRQTYKIKRKDKTKNKQVGTRTSESHPASAQNSDCITDQIAGWKHGFKH